MYFRSYRLQIALLLKFRKRPESKHLWTVENPVSEHLWGVNILNGPKHCWNVHGSSLVICFDHSERNSVKKYLS